MKLRYLVNCGISVFVAFNLYYPLTGLGHEKFDTWGEFTWNMYSQTYRCGAKYYLELPDGRQTNVDVQQYFRRRDKLGRVLHKDILPTFHAFLCEQLERQGRVGTLMGSCSCTIASGETQQLLDTTASLCTGDNHGVLLSEE